MIRGNKGLRKYCNRIASFGLSLMLVCLSFSALNAQTINYRSQSLFIYKFTKYIYWPEDKQKGDFVIGVYGNSPIFNELITMATIKKAGNGQNIVIKKIKSPEELNDNLHIVYITSSKSRELDIIIEKIRQKPILIIAERGGLAKKGAAINFMIMENNDLKFEINTLILKKHNLQIDKELLQIGFVVG